MAQVPHTCSPETRPSFSIKSLFRTIVENRQHDTISVQETVWRAELPSRIYEGRLQFKARPVGLLRLAPVTKVPVEAWGWGAQYVYTTYFPFTTRPCRSFLLSWNSSPYNHDATIAKVLAIHSGAAFIPGQVVTPSGLSVAVVTRHDRLWGPHPQSDSFCG